MLGRKVSDEYDAYVAFENTGNGIVKDSKIFLAILMGCFICRLNSSIAPLELTSIMDYKMNIRSV